MLKWFRCQAGIIEVKDCLERCPMESRCMTRPTLLAVSAERAKWTCDCGSKALHDDQCACGGKRHYRPSTTELINGTIYSWLKITRDYTIRPESRAFALLGTRHHARLEAADDGSAQTEIHLDDEVTGVADLLENEHGVVTLTDMKTWGSFKVAKCLGMTKVAKQFVTNPHLVDMLDVELQLNKYRIDIESSMDVRVDRMQVQVTVRDGMTYTAKNRGIDREMYLIPVKRLPDEDVREYFARKNAELQSALASGWYLPCNGHESWGGARCGRYCEVADWCGRA